LENSTPHFSGRRQFNAENISRKGKKKTDLETDSENEVAAVLPRSKFDRLD